MDIPFACLAATVLITYGAKLPLARAMARQPGGYDNREPRRQQSELSDGRGRRASAAHANGFETFAPFAAGVLSAKMARVDGATVSALAMAFVASRLAYTYCYLADVATARSLVWGLGFLITLSLFALAAR